MLNDLYLSGAFLATALIFLVTGYAMGRNSAEKPFGQEKEEVFEPGPTGDDEDPWRDAMEGETEEEAKKRIPTVEE